MLFATFSPVARGAGRPLGIRMIAGGGEKVISVQATGRFLGKLMTFLLKKPVYYVEILFSHYVKVQFQIEIPFPDTPKV